MKLEYKVQLDALDWISVGDDIRYKCYENGAHQIRLVEFGKNMIHPEWCIKGHFGYVLQGKLELEFTSSREVYESGDAIFVPDGIEHKHRPKVLSDKVVFFSVEKT